MTGSPRLLRDSTLYFAGNIIGRLVGLVMLKFYSSNLSTDEYGILNLIEISTTVIAIVFGLQSIGQTLTRIYNDQKDMADRNRVVSTALLAAMGLTGGVTVLAILGAVPIARAVSLPDQVGLIRAGFVAMFFGTLVEVALVYMRMRGRAGWFLAFSLITLAASVGLNIWFIGYRHFGVWGFVSSKLVVSGLSCVLLLGVTFGEVGLAWRPRFAAALGRFGLPLTLAAAADYAIHMSDRLFLAHVSKAEVGVYSLAYTFAFLLSILVTDSFFKSWSVSLYSYAAQPGWQARFSNICAWLVLVLGGAALGISLFGRDLLTVLTPASYYPPMMMLPVLVWGYFFRGFGDFFRDILLIGIGSGTVGRITSFCAVLNILLNFCFIPSYGIWGATWCTFATWVVYAGISWAWAWRTHGIVIQLRPLVTMLLICGVILAVFDAARPESVWLRLAIDCGLFGAFLVATAVFCLGRAERGEAWRYVGGYVAKLRPAGAGR